MVRGRRMERGRRIRKRMQNAKCKIADFTFQKFRFQFSKSKLKK
jgi:hypothetical protein